METPIHSRNNWKVITPLTSCNIPFLEDISNVHMIRFTFNGADVGFTAIDLETTLESVREELRKMDGVPESFVFVSNHIPIPTAQEQSIKAVAFLPVLELQLPGQATPEVSVQMKLLQDEIAQLKKALYERDQLIAQLRANQQPVDDKGKSELL